MVSDLERFAVEPSNLQSGLRFLATMKEAEIAAGQEQIDTKTQELADTDEKNAQAKEDVEDTKKSLSADEQFLMMLKEKCSMTEKLGDQSWKPYRRHEIYDTLFLS